MLDVLPYVVGKKVGAPDGSTVVLSLTGPLVASTAVGARPTAAPASSTPLPRSRPCRSRSPPTTTSGWRVVAVDPDEALVTGVVAIEGDVDLGRRVVRQLNYMF